MILTEIITEDRYEFLKLWYSCKWTNRDGYQESIFMIRGQDLLFEHNWKHKFLWCNYSTVWSVFESKFRYNDLQIQDLITNALEGHLKQGVSTPYHVNYIEDWLLEERLKLKQEVLKPPINPYSYNKELEKHLKNINT